ncbi:MAG: glycosyl hydrolase [Bacteroidota bacterium]|nr:glycosyl hydrolase [Bacteroidota bacterium]
MKRKLSVGIALLSILFPAVSFPQSGKGKLIDVHASEETKALYYNLKELSGEHILFGHQHATQYGHGWRGDENRSDVKSVTGSHPAVIGVDFSGLSGRPDSMIEKEKASLRKTIADTYNRGGVTTACWHFNNPVSKTNFYWNDSAAVAAVKNIIPGGSHNEKYKSILRTIADLVKSIKGNDGKLVPIIFRPYHEFDGGWFWWGKPHCTKDEFITLWRFTISYLRDSLGVHNLVYAFSPDCLFNSEMEYLERWPGNDWVDIAGVDDYNDFGRYGKYNVDSGIMKLKIVSDYAKKAGKLAAFTETGLESIPSPTWWTETLLAALKKAKAQFTYVLVWRNDTTSPTHFYAPFPGQESEADFLKFYNDPYTLFENDLKGIYKLKK